MKNEDCVNFAASKKSERTVAFFCPQESKCFNGKFQKLFQTGLIKREIQNRKVTSIGKVFCLSRHRALIWFIRDS